ncbi:CoA-binding protein [Glaciimonas sp. PAMC28666]|uniref:CoA-binding protein n=1 Tax=Glaciimonas sp. PAMC28666 TaxID=2807626 RepID=UPI001965A8C8|nr:CoA-binding protein [Glaciimonas sp. PAMC28666]QRX84211.1 CoA-binding protein [Glaciimonas sp. PAMC28666]
MTAASANPALSSAPVIAIVGLSNRPDRPSYGVARYMQEHGYRIIPVNPMYVGTHILGEHCYKDLYDAARALAAESVKIDIVDCFRKTDDIPPVVGEAIMIGASAVWMQLDIVNQDAADKAIKSGLTVVMDRCIKIEHALGNLHGIL